MILIIKKNVIFALALFLCASHVGNSSDKDEDDGFVVLYSKPLLRNGGSKWDDEQYRQSCYLAAESGQLESIQELIACLTEKTVVSDNSEKIHEEINHWLRMAAIKGDMVSANNLGFRLEKAIGSLDSKENKILALGWYTAAAESGSLAAMRNVARCLEEGVACPVNQSTKSKAFYWYSQAAKKGNLLDKMNLADCFKQEFGCEESPENGKRALELYKECAEGGLEKAFARLAFCYEKSIGCEDTYENREKANFWFRKASDLGDLDCTFFLASNLFLGIGCIPDEASKVESLALYKKAGFKGSKSCLGVAGAMLYQGIGCDDSQENRVLGVRYLKRAVKADQIDAMFHLAYCYEKAIGCEDSFENKKKAKDLYEDLVNQGHRKAHNALGYCLQYGIGCDGSYEDQEKALNLFTNASGNGDVDAMVNVGYCLHNGIGCEITSDSMEVAVDWFKDAAEDGSEFARMYLGYIYYSGIGVHKNNWRALDFLHDVQQEWLVSDFIGYIYLKEKQYKEAQTYFLKTDVYYSVYAIHDALSVGLLKLLDYRVGYRAPEPARGKKVTRVQHEDAELKHKKKAVSDQIQYLKEKLFGIASYPDASLPAIAMADLQLQKLDDGCKSFLAGMRKAKDVCDQTLELDALVSTLYDIEENLILADYRAKYALMGVQLAKRLKEIRAGDKPNAIANEKRVSPDVRILPKVARAKSPVKKTHSAGGKAKTKVKKNRRGKK